jgi:hypothetical protein
MNVLFELFRYCPDKKMYEKYLYVDFCPFDKWADACYLILNKKTQKLVECFKGDFNSAAKECLLERYWSGKPFTVWNQWLANGRWQDVDPFRLSLYQAIENEQAKERPKLREGAV